MDDAPIRHLLKHAQTVAVYGMSRDPTKASHRVPAMLTTIGFEVVPINPFADQILGRRCYRSLMDIPGHIDVVDVFRPAAEALAVVEEALLRHRERGDVELIWLQLGITNRVAQDLAAQAGVNFVQDRCLAVEIPRLFPEGLRR